MKRPFLVIAIICLVLFVAAGLLVGELMPYLAYSGRGRRGHGPSMWAILQNISAVVGLASFIIQIVQWRRDRRS
jgi:hypothetical protein